MIIMQCAPLDSSPIHQTLGLESWTMAGTGVVMSLGRRERRLLK